MRLDSSGALSQHTRTQREGKKRKKNNAPCFAACTLSVISFLKSIVRRAWLVPLLKDIIRVAGGLIGLVRMRMPAMSFARRSRDARNKSSTRSFSRPFLSSGSDESLVGETCSSAVNELRRGENGERGLRDLGRERSGEVGGFVER